MICPVCDHENPPAAASCAHCGKSLFVLQGWQVLASRYEIQDTTIYVVRLWHTREDR